MSALPAASSKLVTNTQRWWKSRNRRERGLITIVGIGVVLALLDTGFWQPLLRERRLLTQRIDAAQQRNAELNAKLQPATEASAQFARRIVAAQNELALADTAISDLRRKVVAPEQMASQIRGLLAAAKDLDILSFKNSAARALDTEGTSASNRQIGLYRHPLEIRVTGSYANITRWIAHIEQGFEGVFLTSVTLESVPAGRIEAGIELFTLGTEATWLTL